MDGVIAIFWTDLDPGKETNCPQSHHCAGGGNVYYQVNADNMVVEYAAVQSWSWCAGRSQLQSSGGLRVVWSLDVKWPGNDSECGG